MMVMARAARLLTAALLSTAVMTIACSLPAQEPERAGRGDRCPVTTWESAYGDPTLVPTREGEQVRRDLATASAIRETVKFSAGARARDVHVAFRGRIRPRPTTRSAAADEGLPGQARVTVIASTEAELESLRPTIHEIVRASAREPWTPAQTEVVFVAASETPPETPARGGLLDLALAMALIGFGASMGISLDRAAARRRA